MTSTPTHADLASGAEQQTTESQSQNQIGENAPSSDSETDVNDFAEKTLQHLEVNIPPCLIKSCENLSNDLEKTQGSDATTGFTEIAEVHRSSTPIPQSEGSRLMPACHLLRQTTDCPQLANFAP